MAVKSLTLLKEIVPTANRIAILTNPTNSSLAIVLNEMQAAAEDLRLEITVVKAKAPAEFEIAFAEIADRAAGLVILADSLFTFEAERIANLAIGAGCPRWEAPTLLPESGGVVSYGADQRDLVRRTAVLVKGAKPGDLPNRAADQVTEAVFASRAVVVVSPAPVC